MYTNDPWHLLSSTAGDALSRSTADRPALVLCPRAGLNLPPHTTGTAVPVPLGDPAVVWVGGGIVLVLVVCAIAGNQAAERILGRLFDLASEALDAWGHRRARPRPRSRRAAGRGRRPAVGRAGHGGPGAGKASGDEAGDDDPIGGAR